MYMEIDAHTEFRARLRGVCRLKSAEAGNPWRHLSYDGHILNLGKWTRDRTSPEITPYASAEAARPVLLGAIFLSNADIRELTHLPAYRYKRERADLWLPVVETLEQQFQNGQIPSTTP